MKTLVYPLALLTVIIYCWLQANFQSQSIENFDTKMAELFFENRFIEFFSLYRRTCICSFCSSYFNCLFSLAGKKIIEVFY